MIPSLTESSRNPGSFRAIPGKFFKDVELS